MDNANRSKAARVSTLAAAGFVLLVVTLAEGSNARAESDGELHVAGLDIEVRSEPFARRGDATVTQADFDAQLSRMPAHHRPAFLSDPERVGRTLDNLMMPRQLLGQARENGFIDNPDLQAKLYQGTVVAIAEEYLEHLWQRERLDDYGQQAREIYMTRPDLVQAPLEVDFVHVLVRSDRGRGELDAMRRILAIYDEMLEDEEKTLEELALAYSDDPAVDENGGRYEGVELSSLEQEVATYLRFLEPSQMSEPFRSSHGWHIVRLDRRERPSADSYQAVKERALRVAENRHRQQVRDRHLAALYSDPLELAPGALEKLLDRYQATEEDIDKLMGEIIRQAGQAESRE